MHEAQAVTGEVVFILARYDTSHTTAATRDIEGKSDLHILLTPTINHENTKV
jgi:hypothetical protein